MDLRSSFSEERSSGDTADEIAEPEAEIRLAWRNSNSEKILEMKPECNLLDGSK